MRKTLSNILSIFIFLTFVLCQHQYTKNAFCQSTLSPATERGNNFFDKDVAKNVFADPVSYNEAPELEAFPRQPKNQSQKEKIEPSKNETKLVASNGSKEKATFNNSSSGKSSKENLVTLQTSIREETGKDDFADELVAKFGDPNKDAEIPVTENAPKPFKAMQAALAAKRTDLALLFAKQYIRHFKNLELNTKQILELTNMAFMEEQQKLLSKNSKKTIDTQNEFKDQAMEILKKAAKGEDGETKTNHKPYLEDSSSKNLDGELSNYEQISSLSNTTNISGG